MDKTEFLIVGNGLTGTLLAFEVLKILTIRNYGFDSEVDVKRYYKLLK